jgi:exodeoxyribonuclease I
MQNPSSTVKPTFLWHDYETWGIHPARDRPAQFAAIRTDMDLNIIGQPIELYCRLPSDYLPDPNAMLITGIPPQRANTLGVCEAEFIQTIHESMSQPNTCSVGYNSIRFDDEVTRHTLYRNFFDAYAREWQHGCSRWDLIDLVRSCYALRPEGIVWPTDADGQPTFRLEKITEANGIEHSNAHDALADVQATLALARLIKQAQPRLFDYYFNLRLKKNVKPLLNTDQLKPMIHVSGFYGHARHCTSVIAPLMVHPHKPNTVVCVDLNQDIQPLFDEKAATLKERLYQSRRQLGDTPPVPLTQVAINQCPMIAPLSLLDDTIQSRLQWDIDVIKERLAQLQAAPHLLSTLNEILQPQATDDSSDMHPDLMLYRGSFFNEHDKQLMATIRTTPPEQLCHMTFAFHDPRLSKMLFYYKGRNYPHLLAEHELQQWQEYCQNQLQAESYLVTIENLVYEHEQDSFKLSLIRQLIEYLHTI